MPSTRVSARISSRKGAVFLFQPSSLLAGKVVPASEPERLEYAILCSTLQQHTAAARLYTEAFAAEPKLADHLQAGHRYNAACAVARAGCQEGEDAARLDDAERARLRRQALGWLQADLAVRRKQIGSERTGESAQARQALAHWQKDTDLAGVRDPVAVAKRPVDERHEWERLWADVAEALRQPEPKQ
jgi:serine/threonine-protein kinase